VDECRPLSTGAADLVRLLVDNGADVNAIGTEAGGDVCSPLWWAAMAVHCGEVGGLELATLLVNKGAAVNAVGTDGEGNASTPLSWGKSGGLELAKLLVEKGADVNAVGTTDRAGEECTSLWLAAMAAGAYTRPRFRKT